MLHVISAQYLGEYRIHVAFNNGQAGEIDLSESLSGPIFQPLTNQNLFGGFRIEGHTIAWPNGADFAPEYLLSLLPVPKEAFAE